jgi:predicted DNA-binding protein
MTTSVRLTPQIEQTLIDYCDSKGLTKTQVMSNAIVDYIAKDKTYSQKAANEKKTEGASPIYKAFLKSGLIGAIGADTPSAGRSATKQRVREAAIARLTRKS